VSFTIHGDCFGTEYHNYLAENNANANNEGKKKHISLTPRVVALRHRIESMPTRRECERVAIGIERRRLERLGLCV
jgi:hypothetical protein